MTVPEFILHNGIKIPALGLGTWKSKDGDEVISAVKHALDAGYRHLDTASVYDNESGVGKAVQQSGIQRSEIFITTKVWNTDQGFESTLKAFDESLRKLGTDYIDLYLIHWPVKDKYKQTWKALEKIYYDGTVKAIGVSNFHLQHLDDLLETCEVIPMVNQLEYHPLLTQNDIVAFCKQKNIRFEAWSPLMQGHLSHPLIEQLAGKYGKSPAQIILRWDIQNSIITIPKSIKPSRISENINVFDFELSEEDVVKLNGMNINRRFGPNPDTFNF